MLPRSIYTWLLAGHPCISHMENQHGKLIQGYLPRRENSSICSSPLEKQPISVVIDSSIGPSDKHANDCMPAPLTALPEEHFNQHSKQRKQNLHKNPHPSTLTSISRRHTWPSPGPPKQHPHQHPKLHSPSTPPSISQKRARARHQPPPKLLAPAPQTACL